MHTLLQRQILGYKSDVSPLEAFLLRTCYNLVVPPQLAVLQISCNIAKNSSIQF